MIAVEPLTGGTNLADPMAQYIEQVRTLLQDEADAEGTGEVVTWHKAEWVANRMLQKRDDGRETAPPGPSGGARSRCPLVASGDTRAPVIHFSA